MILSTSGNFLLRRKVPRQFLKVMKLSAFLLTVAFIQVQAKGYSQVTLSFKEAPVEKVFREIERQTDYGFLYTKEMLVGLPAITINVKRAPIKEVLNQCFKGQSLEYSIDNNTIVITRKIASPGTEATVFYSPPPVEIHGRVVNQQGEPLPNVSVIIAGTTEGSATNNDGRFTITAPNSINNIVLEISSVGYLTKKVNVGKQTEINITLELSESGLSDVVVVGYGTQKKSDIVGSVYSIPKEKLEQNHNSDFFQLIQGAAPGLNLQRSSGDAGSSGSILIRGQNSITANNSPLIILDGIPFSGSINEINPNDIGSVELLEDASAAAIYGSRAANGVILITSKSGLSSGTKIELNTSWSLQNEAVKYQLMNPDQFYKYRKQAYQNDGLLNGVSEADIPKTILQQNELISYDRHESVDWIDEMLNKNSLKQNYQLGVRTGNKGIKEYFSASYLDDGGIVKGTGFNRITLNNNLEISSIADWLKIGDNLLYTVSNYQQPVWGINNQPAYYRLSPFSRIYEDDGSLTKFPQANDDLLVNPVAEMQLSTQKNNFSSFFNNFHLDITPEFLPGFSYRMNFGSTLRNTFNALYWGRGTFIGDAVQGSATVQNSNLLDLTWENIIKYNATFKEHNINFTGLYSRQYDRVQSDEASAAGFVSDNYLWRNLAAGSSLGTPASNFAEWNLVSYMARLNYNYKSKYYLTATVRTDGYSGFAADNKYATFPSFAVAWKISGENFMSGIKWLDNLKLRASYGSLGNQAVGTYRSLAQLSNAPHIFGQELYSGLRVSSLANSDLSWETTTTLNTAADFSILAGRISGTLEYYKSKTKDILLNRQIPSITGQTRILYNIGKLQNTGFQTALNIVPIKNKNFSWSLNLNFSTVQNKILQLYGDDKDDVTNLWFIGEPLGVYYDYQFGGIWQTGQESDISKSATPTRKPGDAIVIDQNNDGVIDALDKKIVGHRLPDWMGGIGTTLTFKRISLNVFAQTIQGRDGRLNIEGGANGRFNAPPVNYWTAENNSNSWVKPSSSTTPFFGSMDIYDASFWRIKDITLNYDFSPSLLKTVRLEKVSVFVNLHDYFTVTNYPYMDPESTNIYATPIPKYIQFGLNVTF